MENKILEREIVFQGSAFRVERLQLMMPDARVHPYELVNHADSVIILPVDEQNQLWWVRQYRVGVESELLELPAGVLEAEEDPEEGAAREIREEIGMAAGKLHCIGDFYLAPGYDNEHMWLFLATDLYPAPLESDPDEFIEIIKMPVMQAYALSAQQKIKDSKTLAALLLAVPYLLKSE